MWPPGVVVLTPALDGYARLGEALVQLALDRHLAKALGLSDRRSGLGVGRRVILISAVKCGWVRFSVPAVLPMSPRPAIRGADGERRELP